MKLYVDIVFMFDVIFYNISVYSFLPFYHLYHFLLHKNTFFILMQSVTGIPQATSEFLNDFLTCFMEKVESF